ncbi:hypothetical protein AKJ16_DCAP13368 [Drosera capensis]
MASASDLGLGRVAVSVSDGVLEISLQQDEWIEEVVGIPLAVLGLGAGGGCGVGLGLGWGFGTGFGCKYRSSKVTFLGVDFDSKSHSDVEEPRSTSKTSGEDRASQ